VEAFQDYVRSRKHYSLNGGEQAWYENVDTGTYFSFEYGDPEFDSDEEEAESGPAADSAPVSFNMNFYRPHTFGLEAVGEVEQFIRAFDLLVDDPQGAMIDGHFSAAEFLKGWNEGNEFGYRAIVANNRTERPLVLPRESLEKVWRWNSQRDDLQERYNEADVFVPRILFLKENQIVRTAVVWGDGVAIAVPSVDRIIVPRRKYAPFRLFGKREDTALLTWDEAALLLSQFPRLESGGMPFYLLDYDSPPPLVVNFVKRQRPFADQLHGVAPDNVLTSDLVEKALTRADVS
jgi:hypothetical protein